MSKELKEFVVSVRLTFRAATKLGAREAIADMLKTHSRTVPLPEFDQPGYLNWNIIGVEEAEKI